MADQKISAVFASDPRGTWDGTEEIPANVGGSKGAGLVSDLRTYMQKGLVETIEFVIDGSGATITTGMKGYLEIPVGYTINRATLLADQSGSIVVDIFKCTYANFDPTTHPASGDKITASAPPTITTAKKSQDATLTGWTTAITAGDILGFNVNSVTTIQRVTVSLKVTRT